MSKARVLIVEDEGIEALSIQERLIALGYSAPDIVFSGEDAIEKAAETCPDLALMDIRLNGEIDGVAAAEQIRSRFDIPVVYLTAYADEGTLRRAKITEPYGYVVKPFRDREMHITIDMALYRHQMEKKLRESEKWLATTLRSIGDGVIATDRDGLITFMNGVAEGLTGWKLEEVSGRRLTDIFNIVSRHTRKPVENPVTRVMLEGTVVGLANHTELIARDGREIPIDDSAAPIKDDKGNIIGVILVFRDVTEREEAEEARQKYISHLEEVDRLKDEFLSVAAHELRTPITSLAGFAQTLLRQQEKQGTLDPERLSRGLHVIVRQADKLAALVTQLLDVSRIEAGRLTLQRQHADLVRIVEDVAAAARLSSDHHEIVVQAPPRAEAFVDPLRIEQVITNLVDNAIQYSPSGPVEIRLAAGEGPIEVAVRDHGIGIPSEHLPHIFERFYRADRGGHVAGLGLGLYISNQIVALHGGQIRVECPPDGGTCFSVTLPG